MEKKELKDLLIRINDDNSIIPEKRKAYDLAVVCLEHIGDTDMGQPMEQMLSMNLRDVMKSVEKTY